MLFISGLFRLVFIGLVLYVIFILVRFIQSIGRAKRPAESSRAEQGTMVKDEICNMYLPREEAIREIREGREHYFCSDECRRKFIESLKKS
jgi:uncharacterized protein